MTFTLEEILAAAETEAELQKPRSPPPEQPLPSPPPQAMIDIALGLAGRGRPVFPCNPLTKRPLTPKDKDANGNPIPRTGGLKKATTDIEQVKAWWIENPNAMVGLPTGEPIGAWVLEIDVADKDGVAYTSIEAQVTKIEAEIGVALPPTVRVKTPRGGEH